MTVKELIKKLKAMPQNLPVKVEFTEGNFYDGVGDVDEVYVSGFKTAIVIESSYK